VGKIIKTSRYKIASSLEVSKLVSSFLAAQDVKEISKVAYKKDLEKFLSWLATEKLSKPNREAILKFKGSLIKSGLSANTVNSYLVAVKLFFAYLEGIKQYPNIAKDIKRVKQSKGHLRESLTISQIRNLLAQIDSSTFQGKRDFAIVNLMARTGLRTIEVIRANVGDIKQEGGGALLFIHGKGRDSKDSFVILTEKMLNSILDYLKVRGKAKTEQPLFVSQSNRNKGQRLTTRTIRQLIKNSLRKININSNKLSAHSLRHTFATLSLRTRAPILQVKEALKHASIETTQKYLHNIDRVRNGAERYIDF